MVSSALTTTAAVVGGVAGLALLAWPVVIWLEVKKLEKPKFTLIKTLGMQKRMLGGTAPVAELRRYAPYLIAEVTVEGATMRKALASGFRQIANFIFGNNAAAGTGNNKVAMTSPVTLEKRSPNEDAKRIKGGDGAKIAMTSPVATVMPSSAEGKYTVSFIMPSKYTTSTLPKPNNPAVHIREVPSQTLAAISWRGGSPTEAQVEARRQQLQAVLQQEGLELADPDKVLLWQYYPPFAPAWLRLQDVLVPVKD